MGFKKYCLAIIFTVFVVASLFSLQELPQGVDSVFVSLHLFPAGQETQTEILYRISAQFSCDGVDPYISYHEFEQTGFDSFSWRINGREYPYVDLQDQRFVRYLGRDRKEPFVWLPKDGTVEIVLVESEQPLWHANLSVPPKMPSVSIRPTFSATVINTHDEYTLDWPDVHSGTYSFMVSYRSGQQSLAGRGNSVATNELQLGPDYLSINGVPAEYLGIEVNTESRIEQGFDIYRLRIVIQGPRPWSVAHERLDESHF